MTKRSVAVFQSSNVRGFIFFLLLTCLFSLLIKLGKTYTKTYQLPVKVIEVPLDRVVQDINPSTIEVNTQLSGFSLLANAFKKHSFEISFKNLDQNQDFSYSFDPRLRIKELDKAIYNPVQIMLSREQSIQLKVDKLSSKKVAVYSNINFSYNGAYGPSSDSQITPDSITIVGPKSVIQNINRVGTEALELPNITTTTRRTVAIDTIGLSPSIELSHSTVAVVQEVSKFTEGSFNVPINIINASDKKISLYPKKAQIYFVTSLEEYDEILATDFSVIANYKNRNVASDMMFLEIDRAPSNVSNVRLGTKQVKYVIVN